MSLQLQMEQKSGYLAARFIGAGEPEDVWRQFESIAEHCKRTWQCYNSVLDRAPSVSRELRGAARAWDYSAAPFCI